MQGTALASARAVAADARGKHHPSQRSARRRTPGSRPKLAVDWRVGCEGHGAPPTSGALGLSSRLLRKMRPPGIEPGAFGFEVRQTHARPFA